MTKAPDPAPSLLTNSSAPTATHPAVQSASGVDGYGRIRCDRSRRIQDLLSPLPQNPRLYRPISPIFLLLARLP